MTQQHIQHIWSQGGYYDDDKMPRRRYVPKPSKIREMAMASHEGGRFICPKCHTGFSVTYSVFGRIRVFEDGQFYCRDCARCSDFMKL